MIDLRIKRNADKEEKDDGDDEEMPDPKDGTFG